MATNSICVVLVGPHRVGKSSLLKALLDNEGDYFSVPTMLKGIMMADGVLVLSQPTYGGFSTEPTLEVLAAANLMGKSIAVVQIIKNTADQNQLEEHKRQIRSSFSDLNFSNWDAQMIPIVKVSAQDLSSIGGICRLIDQMPPPTRAASSSSSDHSHATLIIGSSCVVVNNEDDDKVALKIYCRVVNGGTALPAADDLVEVRPGIVTQGGIDRKIVYCPIALKVATVEEANGGLVVLRASATISGENNHPQLRDTIVRGGLQGHMLGHVGSLPPVYTTLKVEIALVPKMWDQYDGSMKLVKRVEKGEQLLLIIGTMSTYGQVQLVEADNVVVAGLTPPTCARPGEKILICRKLEMSWHLIGRGVTVAGRSIPSQLEQAV